ncbi:hypothetical protein [Burkholderia vietnamiensis]|uniref:hypothetical protein n=1 Tax=Burkholderia vietnamiensis TaxID=60552 RepID=UPI001D1447BC|nr:hypothetical protein [Burkholderia vietnamiensis]UEC01683.1 hypothetical protein LK462_06555 [Burkholderia vietnamiensis]
MTANATRNRPRRTAIGAEEERAWVSFYQRARRDPAIAAEVLQQLDGDAEMKREHLALYLCCRESLRLHKAREARNQRIGQFVRWLLGGLFVRGPLATRRALGRGGDIAVACLPEAPAEPAAAQVQQLAANPKVRAARKAFKAETGAQPSAATSSSAEAPPQAIRAGG